MTKRVITLLLLCLLPFLGIEAHRGNIVFKVLTYDAAGEQLSSGHGFYVEAGGKGVAAYSVFKDAYKAEIVDAKGRRHRVVRILGVNANADLICFRVSDDKGEGVAVSTDSLRLNESVEVVAYAKGRQDALPTKVEGIDDFGDYKFYHLNLPNNNRYFGCPLLGDDGSLVGVVQENVLDGASKSCAMDARVLLDMKIDTRSALDGDLHRVHILKGLPREASDALAYIYLLPKQDSVAYLSALNDFVDEHPDNGEGYVNRGVYYMNVGMDEVGDYNMNKALALANGDSLVEAGVEYTWGKTLYELGVAYNDTVSLGKALAHSSLAYEYTKQPIYALLKGDIEFALRHYEAAYESYEKVNASRYATGQSYFSAAQSLLMAGGDSLRSLSLLDSCVVYSEGLSGGGRAEEQAAAYRYIRADLLTKLGRLSAAVADLNAYEHIIGPKYLSSEFYYNRSLLERKERMYKQALDDIRYAKVIAHEGDRVFYHLQEALFLLQLGEYDDAISTCRAIIEEDAESGDAYKIMGLAYGGKKNKKMAVECLKKAVALGDEQAPNLIKQYE